MAAPTAPHRDAAERIEAIKETIDVWPTRSGTSSNSFILFFFDFAARTRVDDSEASYLQAGHAP